MTDHKPRLKDIDQCKGLAIFLVVLGHITSGSAPFPAGAEWYHWLNNTIYEFHMPFFMFLSGLVTFYTFRPARSLREYWDYFWRRLRRFGPAYVLFGLVTSLGKIFIAPFAYVDNVPANFWSDMVKFVVRPMDSSAASLWYVYILIAYAALLPAALALLGGRLEILFVVGALLHFVPVPGWFMLREIVEYMPVFVLGGLAASRYQQFSDWIDRWRWNWLLIFAGGCGVWWFLGWPNVITKLVIGLASIPALIGLVRNYGMSSRFLALLGRYTFAIYLMNVLAIGASKAVIFKVISWDGPRFLFVGPVLLASGVFVPVLVKKYLFCRLPWLDNITT